MIIKIKFYIAPNENVITTHFMIPLLSDETLCYSIEGLAFNVIYSKDFIINALFIDNCW